MAIENLKREVLRRHASIHAFCKAHPELARASVYLVLSGRYPGDWRRQAAKIRDALCGDGGKPETCVMAETLKPALKREEMAPALQTVRCGNCRRLDRRGCADCRRQTEREALELYSRLFPGL